MTSAIARPLHSAGPETERRLMLAADSGQDG
jgi:hypothetical protein